MEQPLISVVMPTYNSQQYIEMSIDSILNQTYQNFEFIIVDGHSTDGTEKLLEQYTQKDKRIIVIPDKKKGIGAALRLGCSLAKGQYIARMDADDIALPSRLEKELKVLEENKGVVIVASSLVIMDEKSNDVVFSFSYSWPYILKKNVSVIAHPSIMMRKDVYIKSGGYPCIKRIEDYILWKRMRKYGSIYVIKEPLLKYRVLSNSLTNTTSPLFWNEFKKVSSFYVQKDILMEDDFVAINSIIDTYLQKEGNGDSAYRRNLIEKKTLNCLSSFLPEKISYKIVYLFKNLTGLIKFLLRPVH